MKEPWQSAGERGVSVQPLYEQPGFADTMRLERWAFGVGEIERHYLQDAELLVLGGELTDGEGTYAEGTWLRLPGGTRQRARTTQGCKLYIKEGGFAYLSSTAH